MSKVIDLPRAKRALAALDKLVIDHPELCQGDGPRWTDNLEELDKLTMGTPTKERTAAYRRRLREKGYRTITVNMQAEAHERLLNLSQQMGIAGGDLLTMAFEQYEKNNTRGGDHA